MHFYFVFWAFVLLFILTILIFCHNLAWWFVCTVSGSWALSPVLILLHEFANVLDLFNLLHSSLCLFCCMSYLLEFSHHFYIFAFQCFNDDIMCFHMFKVYLLLRVLLLAGHSYCMLLFWIVRLLQHAPSPLCLLVLCNYRRVISMLDLSVLRIVLWIVLRFCDFCLYFILFLPRGIFWRFS